MSSRDVLDQVYSLAQLEAFRAEAYVSALRDELGTATTIEELAANDTALRGALEAVDVLAARAMKLRLEHALAMEPAVPAVTRNVFATTIVQYARNVALLAQRVREIAARGGARDVDAVVRAVTAAATEVLAMRDGLRVDVLELARERAKASVELADARSRDKRTDDAVRKKWSRARRDLEAVAADPSRIVTSTLEERMATFDDQIDEPAPEAEPSIADLIELD